MPLVSDPVGEMGGGGPAIGGWGGAKDGIGEVLSRFKRDGTGLEKFIAAFVAISGRRSP